jgi:hypothetical protein
MQSMMTRMTKALSMAKMEDETAVTILRSSGTRPKSRMTRRARMSRTSHDGTDAYAMSSTDMLTTNTSNQFCARPRGQRPGRRSRDRCTVRGGLQIMASRP